MNNSIGLRLSNRHIVLGITGGIAAYKSAELTRLLRQHGASVQIVMTAAAKEFITPLTMQALSGNQVHDSLLDTEAEAAMGHIELGRWADVVLVAPASADFISRVVQGRASELLTAICLATEAPVLIAPAMNQGMWHADSTQANIAQLRKNGMQIHGPVSGEQACGDIGMGRMLEPEALCVALGNLFGSRILDGIHIVITAGGTREPIDAVRYIGNRSSGRMGYALARAAIDAGAHVTLISSANLELPDRVEHIPVETAAQMQAAVAERLEQCQIYIGTAAVADFRPQEVRAGKMNRRQGDTTLALTPNADIIKSVTGSTVRPFVVGFAAETEDVIARARLKMRDKNMDMVCANQVGIENTGFDAEENELYVLYGKDKVHFKRAVKSQIATRLVALIAKQYRIHQKG
jgi:phosphopantothenoylcysteine decarboxylase/phosphopantothenate--cysteine ligase